MLGMKLYKNSKNDMAKYTETAVWCNANDAHIEDKGEYYEVVENTTPEPTKEEQKELIIAQYTADKDELIKYITEANAYGDDITDLQAELLALDKQFDEDIKALEREE